MHDAIASNILALITEIWTRLCSWTYKWSETAEEEILYMMDLAVKAVELCDEG